MAEKAKHAFGALENVDSAISSGKIDAYDILFVKDAAGKPYVGWVDKDGEKVIVDHTPDLTELENELENQIASKANASDVAALETEMSTKASAEEVAAMSAKISSKADSADVAELEMEVAKKVDAATVQTMINEATVGVIEVVEF